MCKPNKKKYISMVFCTIVYNIAHYFSALRQNVKVEKNELLLILRSYQLHPADYDGIIDEILENKCQLSSRAAEYYTNTPKPKLRSRGRDQIFLMLTKRKNIDGEEIRYLFFFKYENCK